MLSKSFNLQVTAKCIGLFDDRPDGAKSKINAVFGVLIVANIAAWTVFADEPALLGNSVRRLYMCSAFTPLVRQRHHEKQL
ncbi:hypothetical protein [Sinorhizobium psoraleae]|uniref:Transposase n=1 Tax=Sinorhizobium psoraleae TaxID=520838 RepID=A0ABT4KN82_9HYPH|nr:hypothetical protein [Sinorhizobium psoraleae]MCZ4093309.1 hypothetical protein [Sinorhizobium psoraleae]